MLPVVGFEVLKPCAILSSLEELQRGVEDEYARNAYKTI